MLPWVVIYRRHFTLSRMREGHCQAHKPTAIRPFRSPRPLLRCAFCIPDGIAGRSVVQTLRRSGGSSHVFAHPLIAYRRSATLLESTLEKVPHKAGLTTFRINTCKSGSKQRTLTIFRITTYGKQGEGGPVIVNQKSDEVFLSRANIGSEESLFISEKEICPEEPPAVGDEGSRGDYNLFQTEASKQMSPLTVLTGERG